LSQWVPGSAIQNALNRWLFALAGLFFLLGAQLYAQRKPWIVGTAIAAGLLAVAAAATTVSPIGAGVIVVPSALLFVGVAAVFWIESRRQETLADRLLAISFFAWAILRLVVFFVFYNPAATLDSGLRPLAAVPSALVAM